MEKCNVLMFDFTRFTNILGLKDESKDVNFYQLR